MHKEDVPVEKALTKYCRHVYEEIGYEICPDCGRYTHEIDRALQSKLFKEYYASVEPKKYKCPIEAVL
jgi:4-hydroxy-3-methylbut-2-en-1-yl diphosphate synthase IspG/GcpE